MFVNKLVAVVGMSGSGKSIACDYLESIGWNKIYFGGVVLEKMKEEKMEITPENEKKVREKLREKHGMAVMAILLLPKIKESLEKNNTVLDGLYSWDEFKVLKEEFQDRLELICIVVDKKIRYERVARRKIRPLNSTEIRNRDISEIENIAKGGPIAISDYYVFNNSTIEDYYKRLMKIIEDMDKEGEVSYEKIN